jgi:uncharacterized protein (TIGR00255 family)
MTGYGKSTVEIAGRKITVEIKSLNSKQLDLSIKAPAIYRECESWIRAEVSKQLNRGKVDVYINVETCKESALCQINRDIYKSYYHQLFELSQELGFSMNHEQSVQAILRLPDVMKAESNEVSEDEISALKNAVNKALENIIEFRKQEGAVLINDLLNRIEKIRALAKTVEPFEQERVAGIKNRLLENLATLTISVDNNRLEQELIFYFEKLDITEEKVRLNNHLNYFREVADNDDFPGRKLGFIAQEIGREINTLGSKANHAEIQKIVVQMKDELEKIKEQLLNLL